MSLADGSTGNPNYYFTLKYKTNLSSATSSTYTLINSTSNASPTAVGSTTSESPGYAVWTN